MPFIRRTTALIATGLAVAASTVHAATEPVPPDFTKDVAPILAKYCVGCHNAEDREGDLSLESFAGLVKGGSRGTAIVPGRADASLLIRALIGEVEPSMPPEDNERPSEREIAVLRAWIDAGAKGPDGSQAEYPELTTPDIVSSPDAEEFLTSIAVSPDGKRLALGRYRHVDIVDAASRQVLATTAELPGKANSVMFSGDGASIVAASGISGLYGVATLCRTDDAAVLMQVMGHRDTLYDARLSPDGTLLATCSYDRQIMLWEVATGRLVKTLAGHNGAVFEVAFSPDGSLLASASADGTVKIWSVASGERLDTLGQAEGEQSAVAISPDGRWIAAGGADRQLRMWRLVSRERPEINPLRISRTAHESPIVELAFSPDGSRLVTASEGRELMLWDTAKLTPVYHYEVQPDVVTGIAFNADGGGFYVSRIDGSWQHYELAAATPHIDNDQPANDTVAASAPEPLRFDGTEQEPNNLLTAANAITANATVRGVINKPAESGEPDVDLFRFQAHKGQQCIVEINAARQKSPLDSRIQILDAAGKPVPRVLLQAVRETYFTFRGHNSSDLNDFRLHGWEDMELNEYLYANGEVVKLWLYPRGPDSGYLVYPGFGGERYTYFGTTAITHALNEPCYIVEPYPPSAALIPNGLPQYLLYYENDDDGWRKLGADSRVAFVAPADGEYLVRVSDMRDQGGDDYKYELHLRAARPDFQIKVEAPDLTINSGSGNEITIVADRIDDFDGDIHVDVAGLPPGFHISTPLIIQAGQTTAYATLTADADAPAPTAANAKVTKLTPSAVVNGKWIVKDALSLGELKLAEKPKVLSQVISPSASGKAVELVISPGETTAASVKVERNGFEGEITFGSEFAGRNLPHGVYIDNIGLNGMTLLAGETEREFFITAAKWVPETTRPFHLRAEVEGNQTSPPVLLHVRRKTAGSGSNTE
jgi:WD40 repeat protein